MTEFTNTAKELVSVEIEALKGLGSTLDSQAFLDAVEIIYQCKERLVITGMGKSGIIGNKIAATLSSTGTPAIVLHPAEALHGDLGVVREGDVVLALSNSGETEEIISLLPSIKLFGNKLISITSNVDSTLARESDAPIVYHIDKEGCPLNLAPMASTTVSLVIGDALSAVLMKRKNFQARDFAKFHPKGSLGRKLLTRVKDLMCTDLPFVDSTKTMKEALELMISTNMGAVLVHDDKLLGIISDGDVKRVINEGGAFMEMSVLDAMTKTPITVGPEQMAEEALRIMENRSKLITILPVVDQQKVIGMIRLHDILQAKIG
ncbi:MAG: KpsF/GutQ family sugar-phosphate isomerase [Candidatus Cloacimonetes bacterium]|nr:KpsF/GutQ family sugar-phosphate isomerase [Candidatus Cloacimonadota bacterium]